MRELVNKTTGQLLVSDSIVERSEDLGNEEGHVAKKLETIL